ncbi:MAG: IclR family transcriptional regulator C-terminal domain-containing protein [Solirubrobacteraceae bacterium]
MHTHIGRRLQILTELLAHEAEYGRGLGVVGLAAATRREKTQISRGLKMLLDAGLVERDPESLEYVIGLRILDLAGRAGHPLLLRRARPICQRLASEAGERVSLAVASRRGVLTVETFAAVAPVQAIDWVGQVLPWSTAAGRVLLMAADDESLEDYLSTDGLAADLQVSTAGALQERLRAVWRAGYAVTHGQPNAEPTTVAAPIIDGDGLPVAAVVLAGPAERLAARLTVTARMVIAAADAISRSMTDDPRTSATTMAAPQTSAATATEAACSC